MLFGGFWSVKGIDLCVRVWVKMVVCKQGKIFGEWFNSVIFDDSDFVLVQWDDVLEVYLGFDVDVVDDDDCLL